MRWGLIGSFKVKEKTVHLETTTLRVFKKISSIGTINIEQCNIFSPFGHSKDKNHTPFLF